MSSTFHIDGICAVWRRQLGSLLGNPVGYLFILAFVIAVALVIAYSPGQGSEIRFFTRNIADLEPLHAAMPVALMILLPLLSMGAWASEREQGTEEMLLTLPLSPADAILGKFLAIVSFFSIALACTAYNVIELLIQGSPDLGMVAANYLGWWLAGMTAAALSILGSVLTTSQPVAFIIGLLLSVIVVGHHLVAQGVCWLITLASLQSINLSKVHFPSWFDDFSRGLAPFGLILIAVAVIVIALSLAALALNARRWRAGREKTVWTQVVSIALGLLVAVQLAVIGQRYGYDTDLTREGLLSLADESHELLRDTITDEVDIDVAISKEPPPEIEGKVRELRAKLKAIQRANPAHIRVRVIEPTSAFDELGRQAQDEFGIKPRDTEVDRAMGRQTRAFFLGARVSTGSRTQVIEYFDPGQSVEYELVRAIRGVSQFEASESKDSKAPTTKRSTKRVIGIAETDLKIDGGMDFAMMQMGGGMNEKWSIVKEWEKQYTVRTSVNLDQPVATGIDVLVVPQVSSLTDGQVENLHDWIWKGGPTLLIDDAVPYFVRNSDSLRPDQPRRRSNGNPMMGMPEESGPPKGDVQRLYKGLGLDWENAQVLWSKYNPSHELRDKLPSFFVWAYRAHGSFAKDGPVGNIDAALFPLPGSIRPLATKPESLTFTGLVSPVKLAPFGTNNFKDMVDRGRLTQDGSPLVDESQPRPADDQTFIIAEVRGAMPAIFERLDAADAAAAEQIDAEAKAKADEQAKNAPAKDAKPEEPKPATATKPTPRKGVVWDKQRPVHVIAVSDVDFLSDQMFSIYLNRDNQVGKNEAFRFLLEQRNIQLAANLIDTLVKDESLMPLRSRFPQPRPLRRLEDIRKDNATAMSKQVEEINAKLKAQIVSKNAEFETKINQIQQDPNLDDMARMQKIGLENSRGISSLQVDIANLERGAAKDRQRLEDQAERQFQTAINTIRVRLILIPAIILLALTAVIWLHRRSTERSHIPTSRKRSQP